jgi:DNA repair protein RadC
MENQLVPYGERKVAQVQLVYKTKIKPADRPLVDTPEKAYDILLETWDKNNLELQEQLKVLLLNRQLRLLGIYEAASGGSWHTNADPKLIFTAALKANATDIILAHNHPSGDFSPSKEDEVLTERIKWCGKVLNVLALDHIIVTKYSFYSFANNGLIT